jgi:hypothetical protein
MSREKKILWRVTPAQHAEDTIHADYLFWCPGCQTTHGVWTEYCNGVGAIWSFNGDLERPTFAPSLLLRFTRDITDAERLQALSGVPLNLPQSVCHLFIRDGRIQFLGDCTHALAGKTVPMEAF